MGGGRPIRVSHPQSAMHFADQTETVAADAARLLIRLGLVILMTALPVVAVFARDAIYVLMPVGASVALVGAVIGAEGHGPRHLRAALGSRPGLAALFLAFWAGLSLLWTPFPADAAPRFAQIVGTTALVALLAAWLPARTRAFDLYLLPVGVALGACALLALTLRGEAYFADAAGVRDTRFTRAMITQIVLAWPALGALCLRERWAFAAALALLAAGVAFAGFAQAALAAMGAAAFVFALAMSGAGGVGRALGLAFAALTLAAPALALALGPVADSAPRAGAGLRSMAVWRDMILAEWPHLMTGHGFGAADRALALGYMPDASPRGLPFVVWHDLGALGALAFAFLAATAFRLAARAPAEAAPALLAGLTAVLVLSFLGAASAQIWWVTLLDCAAIAFVALLKGPYRARPAAPGPDETDEAALLDAPAESA